MNIARVKDGLVVNVEIADAEWVAANDGIDGFSFVTYNPELERPRIGLAWSAQGGFEQPPVVDGDANDHVDEEIEAILAGE